MELSEGRVRPAISAPTKIKITGRHYTEKYVNKIQSIAGDKIVIESASSEENLKAFNIAKILMGDGWKEEKCTCSYKGKLFKIILTKTS